MLTLMIPRKHKVGDTFVAKINGVDAHVTWVDADTLDVNGTDRRRILMTDENIDGRGNPVWFFTAGDSQADIDAGHADTITVITPDGVREFDQRDNGDGPEAAREAAMRQKRAACLARTKTKRPGVVRNDQGS